MAEPRWHFYEAPGGGDPVRKDVADALGHDKKGRARLADLMERIKTGATLPRDVKDLKRGLFEARLTHQGCEYRLFFAKEEGGLLLLGLHFARKKAQTIKRAIDLARERLADWDNRV